jgi:hypothetical protein
MLQMFMKPYLTRVTRYTIAPQGEHSFSEQAIQVELVDEAAGEHIRITTQLDTMQLQQEVPIDIAEWPHVAAAVRKLIKESKRNEA